MPQVGKKFELLNCDTHKSILQKNGRDIAASRPDIAHQVHNSCSNNVFMF